MEKREKLHEFIDQADEQMLDFIPSMIKHNASIELTEEQKAILDDRLQSHAENPTEGSDWEVVKKRIIHQL